MEPLTEEEIEQMNNNQASNVRSERNRLLAESDWTQMPDVPMGSEQKNQWGSYRQSLRDITQQAEFPWNVIWPSKPE